MFGSRNHFVLKQEAKCKEDNQQRYINKSESVKEEKEDKSKVKMYTFNKLNPLETGMLRRRSSLKRTKSQWENFILSLDVKKSINTRIFKLTLRQLARDGETFALSQLLQNIPVQERKNILDSRLESDGGTPLHLAARHNHYKVCELLIKYGANVDSKGEGGATPLHYVAKYKPKKEVCQRYRSQHNNNISETTNVITLLASNGANVNMIDIEGQTPMHAACIKGNYKATQLLLQCSDINIKATDNQGMTALHLAATHGYVRIAKLLIKNGADLNSCDNDLLTPLHSACSEGSTEIVEILLKEGLKDGGWTTVEKMLLQENAGKATCLHVSVDKGHKEMLLQLLNWMKSSGNVEEFVNMTTSCNNTALHLAATHGHVEIAEILIDYGAKIDSRNDSLATPLLLAAQYNNHKIVELLSKHNAEMETRDKDNMTPLLVASKSGSLATISWLIKNGADVTSTDKDDKSCLMLAVELKKTRAVQELLQYSSVRSLLSETDKNANSILHIAAKKGHVSIIKTLVDNGARIDFKNEDEVTPVHVASSYGQYAALWQLLEKDRTMINNLDEYGNTALHLAAIEGHTRCIQILLNFGANNEFRNTRQFSALDCACANGTESTVLELLQAKSEVNPPNFSKTTPLHQACLHGHVHIVRLLFKWDADLSVRTNDGRNPLDCAIDKDRRGCVEAILQHENWKQAMRNSYIDPFSDFVTTPMRKLIIKMPEMAELAFTRSITNNQKPHDDVNLEVTLDYEFLDDMYAVMAWNGTDHETRHRCIGWKSKRDFSQNDKSFKTMCVKAMIPIFPEANNIVQNEPSKALNHSTPYTLDCNVLRYNHPLNLMANRKRERLLQHPVVTGLLQYKWKTYGGLVYYSSLAFLLLFLFLLNFYILFIPPPFDIDFEKTFANRRLFLTYTKSELFEYIKPPSCYNVLNHGSDYRGFANVSKTGKPCVNWDETIVNSDAFPEAGLDQNFCRKPPEIDENQPWCYTRPNWNNPDEHVREVCDISICPVYVEGENVPLGETCKFPFVYKNKSVSECIRQEQTWWCSYTDNYDRDGKRGNCSTKNTLCNVEFELRRPCGPADTDERSCEERGCCFEKYNKSHSGTCYRKLDSCYDRERFCDVKQCNQDIKTMKENCAKTCKFCNETEFEHDHESENEREHEFLHLMTDYPRGTYEMDWAMGCYYIVKEVKKKWGRNCVFKKEWEDPIRYLLILLAIVNLSLVTFQIWNYKLDALTPVTLLKCSLFILTILFALNFSSFDIERTRPMINDQEIFDDLFQKFQYETGIRQHWQWQCGAFAVLFSWMHLLLHIRKTPYFGIYVVMFNNMFKTFFKFSTVFLLFIMSFAITFYILIQNKSVFGNMFTSTIKSSVMMTGETEFGATFRDPRTTYEHVLYYKTVTFIIMCVFVVVMMIIIMNLLIGLAVGGIMDVKQNASAEQLKMQVDLALEVEFSVPYFLRKHFVRKSETLLPNRYRYRNGIIKALLQNQNLSSKSIINAMSRNKTETEEISEDVASLNHFISGLSNKANNFNSMIHDMLHDVREMKRKTELSIGAQNIASSSSAQHVSSSF